jgi:two-component system chemotaxis sensor kinase CheA
MAMPLSMVERIATVALRDVEFAGGKTVLQYGGEVVPLEDEGGLLDELAGVRDGTATVLICMRRKEQGSHRTGIVVRRVLDVCAGEMLSVDTGLSAAPLARVNHQITTVHRGFEAVGVLEGAA